MGIWFVKPEKEKTAHRLTNTMVAHLGIAFTEVGDDFIKASMPVDHRTHQPMGILHGGASVALAETLASFAANCCIDMAKYYCVGLEINANHIRSVRNGNVIGCAKPVHMGRTTQIWEVRIHDEEEHLICISRVTMAVLAHKQTAGQNEPYIYDNHLIFLYKKTERKKTWQTYIRNWQSIWTISPQDFRPRKAELNCAFSNGSLLRKKRKSRPD